MPFRFLTAILLGAILQGCSSDEEVTYPVVDLVPDQVDYVQPQWVKSAVVYQLDFRVFTPEGTFEKAALELPRLKKMGINTIHLLPVYKSGWSPNEKGTQSKFCVLDFNILEGGPSAEASLKQFISMVRQNEMHVVLDLPYTTSPDHAWVNAEPERFLLDSLNKPIVFQSGLYGEVCRLDLNHPALREEFLQTMTHWVSNYDVDGFYLRGCDRIRPSDWTQGLVELRQDKPVVMFADFDARSLLGAGFDLIADQKLQPFLDGLVNGETTPDVLFDCMTSQVKWNHLVYTSNQQLHTLKGSTANRFKRANELASLIMALSNGRPSLFNGQEVPINRKLKHLEKDSISWGELELAEFYRKIIAGRTNDQHWMRLKTSRDESILALRKATKQKDELVLMNLTNRYRRFSITDSTLQAAYANQITGDTLVLDSLLKRSFAPWQFKILQH